MQPGYLATKRTALGYNSVFSRSRCREVSLLERIDDPLDAAFSQNREEPENIAGELAVKIAGQLFLPLGIANTLREHFSQRNRERRVWEVLNALKAELDRLARESKDDHNRIGVLEARVTSPMFTEAILAAAEEAVRAASDAKLRRIATVLARGADPGIEISADEDDLASFVRDIGQLSETDIRVLKILYSVFADMVKVYPNLHDPNVFTERVAQLLKKVDESKTHRDDFYSYCKRLEGFGLAIEVPRNIGRMAPGDYCFRPTRRGLKLLSLMEEYGGVPQTATAG